MTKFLTRPRTLPPLIVGLAYLCAAIVLLLITFREPPAATKKSAKLFMEADYNVKTVKLYMDQVDSINQRLSNYLSDLGKLSMMDGRSSNVLVGIDPLVQSFVTDRDAAQKLIVEHQMRAAGLNRIADELVRNEVSEAKRERWLSLLVGGASLLLLAKHAHLTFSSSDRRHKQTGHTV